MGSDPSVARIAVDVPGRVLGAPGWAPTAPGWALGAPMWDTSCRKRSTSVSHNGGKAPAAPPPPARRWRCDTRSSPASCRGYGTRSSPAPRQRYVTCRSPARPPPEVRHPQLPRPLPEMRHPRPHRAAAEHAVRRAGAGGATCLSRALGAGGGSGLICMTRGGLGHAMSFFLPHLESHIHLIDAHQPRRSDEIEQDALAPRGRRDILHHLLPLQGVRPGVVWNMRRVGQVPRGRPVCCMHRALGGSGRFRMTRGGLGHATSCSPQLGVRTDPVDAHQPRCSAELEQEALRCGGGSERR